ncbi:S-layer homology domain-containing protein [Paenibacillus sp. GbtcB18]|uniref:S-layer homology domain-containing protein n=1 Tax=Paenibacillus sp. GbtcB18 TaxID=2824763 RepID=UPI001C2F5BF3|nr:S-layer homology domain-containing protein [Paenibacillus sp. GbtcB18]
MMKRWRSVISRLTVLLLLVSSAAPVWSASAQAAPAVQPQDGGEVRTNLNSPGRVIRDVKPVPHDPFNLPTDGGGKFRNVNTSQNVFITEEDFADILFSAMYADKVVITENGTVLAALEIKGNGQVKWIGGSGTVFLDSYDPLESKADFRISGAAVAKKMSTFRISVYSAIYEELSLSLVKAPSAVLFFDPWSAQAGQTVQLNGKIDVDAPVNVSLSVSDGSLSQTDMATGLTGHFMPMFTTPARPGKVILTVKVPGISRDLAETYEIDITGPPPPRAVKIEQDVAGGFGGLINLKAENAWPDTISFQIKDRPLHGKLDPIHPPFCLFDACSASVFYTPEAGYAGKDGFSYTASNGVETSAPAYVDITVLPAGTEKAVISADRLNPEAGGESEITVKVLNTDGTVDTSFGGDRPITVKGYSMPPSGTAGTMNGTPLKSPLGTSVTVPFSRGEARVTLVLHHAAAQGIRFEIGRLRIPRSNTLEYSPMPAKLDRLTVVRQPRGPLEPGGGELAAQPELSLTDKFGNPVLVPHRVTAEAKQDAGAWTPDGDLTVTAIGGRAVYANLGARSTDMTTDISGTLTFTADNGVKADSSPFVVKRANPAPVAEDLRFNVQADAPLTGKLAAYDPGGDALSYSVVSGGSLGTVSLLDASTGEFRYTPNTGVTGTDTFTYTASDGVNTSREAVVTLVISPREPLMTGIELQGMPVSLETGRTHQSVVNAVYEDGGRRPLKERLVFSSSDETAAVVDAAGLITAKSAGTTVIRAVYGDLFAAETTLKITKAPEPGNPSPDSSGGGGSGQEPVPNPNVKSIYVSAGKSGLLEFNGEMTAAVSEGSHGEGFWLEAEKRTAGPAGIPEGYLQLSPVFEMRKSTGVPLSKPYALTIKLSGEGAGDNRNPAIYYYNGTDQKWTPLQSRIKDGAAAAETELFGRFAVLAPPAALLPPVVVEPAKEHPADIEGHWAQEIILQAIEKGLAEGYEDRTFRPDRTITRGEFIVLLIRALGLARHESGPPSFADETAIPGWAKDAAAIAAARGIAAGYEDGAFRPGTLITRAEMAAMIGRAVKLPAAEGSSPAFSDTGEIPSWAADLVKQAAENGLIEGREGNRFAPQEQATRAEAVVMLLRLKKAADAPAAGK